MILNPLIRILQLSIKKRGNFFEVTVRHYWEGDEIFEFDTEEEAQEFIDSGPSLDAMVEAGDVYANTCEIVDWKVV